MAMINNMPPMYPVYGQENLEAMYPDIYYRVYPTVQRCCEMYDVPTNPGMYPYPTRVAVEQMTDYIYMNVGAMGEAQINQFGYGYGYGGYGFGGGLLRPLIGILLIRELLRRRRPYFY